MERRLFGRIFIVQNIDQQKQKRQITPIGHQTDGNSIILTLFSPSFTDYSQEPRKYKPSDYKKHLGSDLTTSAIWLTSIQALWKRIKTKGSQIGSTYATLRASSARVRIRFTINCFLESLRLINLMFISQNS
jgi:hypothetical protein